MTFLIGRAALAVRLFFFAAFAGVLLIAGPAAAQTPAFTPRDEAPEEFPDLPGREDTFYACVACHNFKLVAQQGMSRHRWESTLDLMVERHGMPLLTGKDREVVLGYLSRAFPEQAPAAQGWQNPFLKK